MIVHAASGGQIQFHAAVKNCDPGQRKAQRLRRAEEDVRFNCQFFQVNIGLIKAVEENQCVRAALFKALGDMRHVAEEWTQLYRDRNGHSRLNSTNNLDISLFDRFAGKGGVSGYEVDVALQCVGTSLLDLSRIIDPPADRRTVETPNDRHIYSLFRFSNEFQVVLGAEMKLAGLWEKREGLGKALGMGSETVIELQTFLAQLFFKQGWKDDCGCSRIFQTANVCYVLRQW